MNTHDSCDSRNGASTTLAAAQAAADATAKRFVNSGDLTYTERAALVDTLKAQVAEIARLERGGSQ